MQYWNKKIYKIPLFRQQNELKLNNGRTLFIIYRRLATATIFISVFINSRLGHIINLKYLATIKRGTYIQMQSVDLRLLNIMYKLRYYKIVENF